MNVRKKRLGRGLDALLSKPAQADGEVPAEIAPVPPGKEDRMGLSELPVEFLQRGKYQPRVDMRQDTLEDLARSIEAQGVVQPIVVREIERDGANRRYEIIAGERRWRAAQMAGLETVPAIVREADDDAVIAMALIENIQREDLNPLEESKALARLIEEFDLTHAEAAEAVGRSRAAVSNLLRLGDLADRVKPLLESRELEMGHARALLAIADPVQQLDVARQIVRKGLSVRATEQLIKRMKSDAKRTGKPAQPDGDIRRLEVEVSEKLGAKVRLDHTARGKGRLVINYNSLDELDGILAHIR